MATNLSTTKVAFYGGTSDSGSAYVGTSYNGNSQEVCTTRFKFTTPATGATSLTFKTSKALCDVNGAGQQSYDSIAYIRFAVTTSSTQYKTTKGNSGYSASYSGSGDGYIQGSLTIDLLPNTVYYLWVFPGSSYAGWTRHKLESCTVTVSGTYGVASTITAVDSTFGSSIPITLDNPISGVTNTLSIQVPTTAGSIRYITVLSPELTKNSETSFTWEPTVATYESLITDTPYVDVTIQCAAAFNGSTQYSTKTIRVSFSAADVTPTLISATVTYDNTGTDASSIATFVQGYSKAKLTAVSASNQHSASIASYKIQIGTISATGSSLPLSTDILTDAGTLAFTVTITDSRGFTASYSDFITVYSYSPPTMVVDHVYRCDSSGNEDDGGTFISAKVKASISSLNSLNSVSALKIAYKTGSGDYEDNEYNLTDNTEKHDIGPINADKSYLVRLRITDALGNETQMIRSVPSQKWALKFNSTATAVAFGKAPEANSGQNVLEIPYNWNIARMTSDQSETHYALFDSDLDPDDHKLKTYTSVTQLGQTSGSATIANVWTALPMNSFLVAQTSEFLSTELPAPAATGTVTMSRTIDSASVPIGYIELHYNTIGYGNYRQYLSSGVPTGTWTPMDCIRVQSGEKKTGSNGIVAVTFSTTSPFSSAPSVTCSARGTSTTRVYEARPANITSTGFDIYCTTTDGSSVSVGGNINVQWIAVGV